MGTTQIAGSTFATSALRQREGTKMLTDADRKRIERQIDDLATGTQRREFLRDDNDEEGILRELVRINMERLVEYAKAAGAAAQREADAKICEERPLIVTALFDEDARMAKMLEQRLTGIGKQYAAAIRAAAPTRGEGE
jgi:hypothetical protein